MKVLSSRSLDGASGGGDGGNLNIVGGLGGGGGGSDTEEVYVVPADEYFVRCPISREVFEQKWDSEEGEHMFRHAVKVLVTEAADASVFSLGRPTSQSGIRYLIVHKTLVMNGWLEQGRADTLRNAKLRYLGQQQLLLQQTQAQQSQTAQAAGDKCVSLTAAAEDEDEDDIFVMLEL